MNVWKERDHDFERDVVRYLNEIAKEENDVEEIKLFIMSRRGYFETKKIDFVEDVKEVIQVAGSHGVIMAK